MGGVLGIAAFVVVVLVVGIYIGTGGQMFATGAQLRGGTTTIQQNGQTGSGTCALAPSVSLTGHAYDYSKTPAVWTQLGNSGTYQGTYGVIDMGTGSIAGTGSLSASGPVTVTSGIQCNHAYQGWVGDNSNTYLMFSPVFSTNSSNPNPNRDIQTAAYLAPTISGNNKTVQGTTGPIRISQGAAGYTNGSSVTEYTLELTEGNGYFGVPGGHIAIGIMVNTTQVTSATASSSGISVNSASKTMPPLSNSTIGNNYVYWFTAPSLGPDSVTDYHLNLQLGNINANSAIANNAIVFVEPGVNLVQNGQPVYDVFFNTTSHAAPIAPIQAQTLKIYHS